MKENMNAVFDAAPSEHFFEGAEKRLEIDFIETANSSKRGMLDVTRQQWETLLETVNCLILSSSSSEDCVSYVLSESSLFVYPFKVMIKTCGNTTLLECLDMLIKYSQDLSLSIDFVTYSHKSFLQPQKQPNDYRSFTSEIRTLNEYFPRGRGFTLGPMNRDRWFIYVADMSESNSESAKDEVEQTIEIIMSQLDRKAMAQFYKSDSCADVSLTSGIADIIPNSLIEDHMFDPCGYSMNGLNRRYYSTIHVTPEPEFSYVSFETNLPVSSYDEIIRKVVSIFKPSQFIVSVFADSTALCGESNKSYDHKLEGYEREIANTCEFTGRRSVTCSYYHAQ